MMDVFRRVSAWVVLGALVATPVQAMAQTDAPTKAEQEARDKAEKERRRQEDKASQRDLRDQKETRDILSEIQPDLDALGIEAMARLYNDRFLQDYVNELGQSLVPKETAPGVLFSFHVLNDPIPNAYALPDGRIYVNSGLLVFAQNEAQLSVVLGHEIGHVVQNHYVESVKASRSFSRAVLPGLLGAATGALVGGMTKGKEGAAVGAAIGLGAGALYSIVTMNSYNRKQEDEADRIGVALALDRGYDPKAAVSFFQKLTTTYGDNDRLENFLWAKHSRNVERIATINALLDGQLPSYSAARASGKLTVGSGQLFLYASRMIRDVAVQYMEQLERYGTAKELLEMIVDYRARDPKTLWALGRLYKTVGRTDTDKAKALEYLQRAAAIDERNMYPYIHRDLGLMQARLGGAQMPAAIESIKRYIRGHVDRYEQYPPDLEEMYDYLLIFGDGKWTAPRVDAQIIRASNPAPAAPAEPPAPSPAPPRPASSPARAVQPGQTAPRVPARR